jgi:hypothetical protein
MRVRAYETGPGFSLESLFAGEMIKRSRRSGATVLDQQIELVAKLFNDPFKLPTTLEDGRSDAEDGG